MKPTDLVLVFLPQNPFPPQSGYHQRCLEILDGMESLGWPIALAGIWSPSWERAEVPFPVTLYHSGTADRYFLAALRRVRRYRSAVDVWQHAPPLMRLWFRRLLIKERPSLVFSSYAYWSGLIPRHRVKGQVSVIDMIDLIARSKAMWAELDRKLPAGQVSSHTTVEDILDETFSQEFALPPSPDEARAYDRFDVTLAISEPEAEAVRANTHRTRVVTLPMTCKVRESNNEWDAGALFAAGPNPFNLQGYLYFMQRIAPLVRTAARDFVLDVTGSACERMQPEPGVVLHGFVSDLDPLYRRARLAICPLIAGTGQKVKVIEAMAHSLPVVATPDAAIGSPIVHGVNGFIAPTHEAFARHVVELWNDFELRRDLGLAAAKSVRAANDRSPVTAVLSPLYPSRSRSGPKAG